MIRQKRRVYESDKSSNRLLQDILPDNSWKGKPCFIVGGGPSLREFPFHRLKGHRTIGVNLAFTKFDPTISFSMDSRFLKWMESEAYGKETTRKFERLESYRVQLMTYQANFPPIVYVVPVFHNYSDGHWAFPRTMKEGIGHGNNSGYAALNLAVCLGANPIFLLGFDMKHDGPKTHWHTGHPLPQTKEHLATFPKYFEHAARKATAMKIKIINLNWESGITCFPKQSWREVL